MSGTNRVRLRFAYADPPYLGLADAYREHHPDAERWNDPEAHRALIARLQDEYPDGWAMSLSSASLRVLLPMCPQSARVGTWITDRPRFSGNQNPVRRHCEPLIWCGGRSFADTGTRAADFTITKQVPLPEGQPRYLMQHDLARKGEVFLGRKPRAFCRWVFDLLGAEPGDTLDDLFPGTGAVSAAWAEYVGDRTPAPALFSFSERDDG